jgi:uncharacterized protein YraI
MTDCGSPSPTEGGTATVTPASVTGAPSPSQSDTPHPTATYLPPTATPVNGKTTYKINVRAGPGAAYASLGMLETGQEVQIIGRNEDESWYIILYPAGPGGRGWIAAQYISLPAGVKIPMPTEVTSTPAGPTGLASQRINVRSGPGMNFNVLGVLEAKTLVTLTGKNQNSTWLQIEYPGGPDERGWVTAAYIQADGLESLPTLDEYGQPVTPGAPGPTSIPMTPTPTIGPAFEDHDSAAAPAVRVIFAAFGTREIIYRSDLSTPDGDAGDWIAFTPYAAAGTTAQITMSLACYGNGSLQAELLQGGVPLQGWRGLSCNGPAVTTELAAGVEYMLHLSAAPGDGLRYAEYTLRVRNP